MTTQPEDSASEIAIRTPGWTDALTLNIGNPLLWRSTEAFVAILSDDVDRARNAAMHLTPSERRRAAAAADQLAAIMRPANPRPLARPNDIEEIASGLVREHTAKGVAICIDKASPDAVRDRLLAWCVANGIDPSKVPGDSMLWITGESIVFHEVIGSGMTRQVIPRSVPLTVPFPDDWAETDPE